MNPFEIQGKTVTFTGATSAPSTVQCVSSNDTRSPQYMLTNIGNVDVWVSYSSVTSQATLNAVIPTGTSQFGVWVLARTQVVISGPPDAFFTGITASGTAIVYVTPGYGE